MNKRLLITLECVLALLIAMICLLPWPTRISFETTGIEVSEDGTVINDCTISMKGWKLDYLFQQDTITIDKLEISTYQNQTFDLSAPNHAPLLTAAHDEFDYTLYDVYFADLSQYRSVKICLDNDANRFVIEARGRYFIVSSDDNSDPEACLDLFASVNKVNMEMHATVINTKTGKTGSTTTLTVNGWKPNQEGEFKGLFQFDDDFQYRFYNSDYTFKQYLYDHGAPTGIQHTRLYLYDTGLNTPIFANMSVDFENACMIIILEDQPGYYIVAAEDPNMSPEDILAHFETSITFWENL